MFENLVLWKMVCQLLLLWEKSVMFFGLMKPKFLFSDNWWIILWWDLSFTSTHEILVFVVCHKHTHSNSLTLKYAHTLSPTYRVSTYTHTLSLSLYLSLSPKKFHTSLHTSHLWGKFSTNFIFSSTQPLLTTHCWYNEARLLSSKDYRK